MFKIGLNRQIEQALDIYANAQTSAILEDYENKSISSSESSETYYFNKDNSCTVTHGRRHRFLRVSVVIVLVSLFLTVAVSALVRLGLLDKLRRVEPDNVNYELWQEDKGSNESATLPDITLDIPDGFALKKEWGNPFGKHYFYINENTGHTIGFDYSLVDHSGEVGFTLVDEVIHTTINGLDADLYPHNDRSSQCNIIWIDEEMNVCIIISTTLSEEELIELAESVYIASTDKLHSIGNDYLFADSAMYSSIAKEKDDDIYNAVVKEGFYCSPAKKGESVYSLCDGIVVSSGYDYHDGNYVNIIDNTRCTWHYKHLDKIYVSEGDFAENGLAIGTVGISGFVTDVRREITISMSNEPIDSSLLNLEYIAEILKNAGSIRMKVLQGSEVYSLCDGIVAEINEWDGAYGRCLTIVDEDGYSLRYEHLNDFLLSEGDIVKFGDAIGHAGNTGLAEDINWTIKSSFP